jgi:predicted choloylglycine hydrolase
MSIMKSSRWKGIIMKGIDDAIVGYLLSLCMITGCVGASTFGMSEEVYQRNLLAIKDRTIPFSVRCIHWDGDPVRIGRRKADFIKENPRIYRVLEDTISLKGVRLGNPRRVLVNMKRYFPEILIEIDSFSEAYGISRERAMAVAGMSFYIGGCSIYINPDPVPFLARNYDWAPTMVDGIISSNGRTRGRHSSIMVSMAIFGAVSGINEHGLAIAIAGINSKKYFPDKGGICMPIIVRGILDKAGDVQSAISLLRELPHTTACNYALVDKKGEMAVVEVASGGIEVRRNSSRDNFLAATNHFQMVSNKEEDIRVLPNSLRRQRAIEEFHSENPEANKDAIFGFMRDTEKGPAMNNYSSMLGTLWTIVYIPYERQMIIRVGLSGDRKSLFVNRRYDAVLKGNLIDRPPKFSDYL